MVRCKAYFDLLNSLGATRECDRQVDGQMDMVASVLCYAAKK